MVFEWDTAKNAANIAKHGIDFEDAIRIFEGPVLESPDERREYGEVRIIAFGVVDARELAVVYTTCAGRRRIISARRAHSCELKAYRQAYPQKPARQDQLGTSRRSERSRDRERRQVRSGCGTDLRQGMVPNSQVGPPRTQGAHLAANGSGSGGMV